jgi:hypothetical protein
LNRVYAKTGLFVGWQAAYVVFGNVGLQPHVGRGLELLLALFFAFTGLALGVGGALQIAGGLGLYRQGG